MVVNLTMKLPPPTFSRSQLILVLWRNNASKLLLHCDLVARSHHYLKMNWSHTSKICLRFLDAHLVITFCIHHLVSPSGYIFGIILHRFLWIRMLISCLIWFRESLWGSIKHSLRHQHGLPMRVQWLTLNHCSNAVTHGRAPKTTQKL